MVSLRPEVPFAFGFIYNRRGCLAAVHRPSFDLCAWSVWSRLLSQGLPNFGHSAHSLPLPLPPSPSPSPSPSLLSPVVNQCPSFGHFIPRHLKLPGGLDILDLRKVECAHELGHSLLDLLRPHAVRVHPRTVVEGPIGFRI